MTSPRTLEATGWPAAAVLASSCAAAVAAALAVTSAASAPGRAPLLAAALAAAAAFFVAALYRPDTMLALTFALLVYVRREPAPVDLAFALLIAAVLVGRRLPWRPPGAVAYLLPLLAAITIASAIGAADESRALRFAATTLFLLAVAAAVCAMRVLPGGIALGFDAYVVAAAVTAALAVAALYVGFPLSHDLLYDPHRAQALFKDPNVFGPFLVPAAVVTLDRLVTGVAPPRRRALLALTLLALAAGIVVSFSRAAWLNLGVAVVVLVVVRFRRYGARAVRRMLALVAAAAVAVYALLAVTGSLSFLEARSHLETYDQSRFSNQVSALDLATRHALGYGPGQAEVNLPLSTHSTYARAAYEQGVIGLALVVALLLVTLVLAYRLALTRDSVWGIGTAPLFGAWAGLIANSAFVDTLHWRHLWVLAGLVWGASLLRPGARVSDGAVGGTTAA